MMRALHSALLLLLGIAACSGGSGPPSGAGTPLFLGENDPVPPPRDDPGSGRENPNGTSGGQGSSSGGPAGGCPCAGNYTCEGIGSDGGAAGISITTSGSTCNWSASGGTAIQLACNGSTSVQGYVYTSSWSGSAINLCIVIQEAQGPTCITCTPEG